MRIIVPVETIWIVVVFLAWVAGVVVGHFITERHYQGLIEDGYLRSERHWEWRDDAD